MNQKMKNRYRVFRRGWGTYYCEDLLTKKQETLRTCDRDETSRLVAAKNESEAHHAFSRRLARVYWNGGDPMAAQRTWDHVMVEIPKFKAGATQDRWFAAIADKAFDSIRNLLLLETRPEHFFKVLEAGTVSTNIYLRRIHNFALAMDWSPWPILNARQWPKVHHKTRRAITLNEHRRIHQRERNPQWRAFYELCWHLGGSQTDVANLTAEDIDWSPRVVAYFRRKTGSA
jgi:hypothetical protein